MCLAVPGKLIQIKEDNIGIVDVLGTKSNVVLDLVPDIKLGDYVLVHVGYAIGKLDEKEALETLELLKEVANCIEE